MTTRNYYLLTIWEMDLQKILRWRSHEHFKEMVIQEEVCDTGRPHYQGGIKFTERVPFSKLRTFAQQILPSQCSVNCKEVFDDGSFSCYSRCVNYCSGSSGNGLMKCANLEHRYRITKNEIIKLETKPEGIKQWMKWHPVKRPEEFIKDDKKNLMEHLKANIQLCQRHILNFD